MNGNNGRSVFTARDRELVARVQVLLARRSDSPLYIVHVSSIEGIEALETETVPLPAGRPCPSGVRMSMFHAARSASLS